MYDLPPIRPAPLLSTMAVLMALLPTSLAAQNVTSAPIAPNDPMISTQWRLKPATPTLETQGLGEPAIDAPRIQAPAMPIAADTASAPIGATPPSAASAPDAASPAPAPAATSAPVTSWRPAPAPQVAPVTAPPAAAAAPAPVRVEPPLTVFIRNPENGGADILPILGIAAITALAIAVGALAFSINRRGKREHLEAMPETEEAVIERVAEPATLPEAILPTISEPTPPPAPAPAPSPLATPAEPRMASISAKIAARQVPVWTISIPTRPAPPPRRRAVRAVIQS